METPRKRKALAEQSIEFFAKYYLAHHILTNIPKIHKTWYKDFTKHTRIARAAPRGHSKTTTHSLVYPLWNILFQKRKFILLISDTQQQGNEILGAIVQELETNPRILRDFGSIAGFIPPTAEAKKKWTTSDIVTTTEIKVMSRGWTGRMRGLKYGARRPDLIVLDDVENDESTASELQREKLANVFYKSILNLGDEETQIIIVGTILHFDSLLNNIIKDPPPEWEVKLQKAIENNKSIWSEYWPMKRLDAKRAEIGNIPFEQEYLQNPLDPSQQIIKPKEFYEDTVDLTMVDCYGYIDLAISEKETADYTAIVTIGRHRHSGKLYVIDPVRIRGDIETQVNLVFEWHKKYKYKSFGVESVAYQKAFHQILVKEGNERKIYVPSIEIEIDKDKVRRAIEITPYVDNGTILFNNSYQDFMAEIVQFPKAAHDDFVDAFAGAVKLATRGGGKLNVRTGGRVDYPT